jgi:RNA polymerase sigma factor (sigma-70 family)
MTTVRSDADCVGDDVYRRHYLPLVRLAVQLVDDLASAEDVVQDVFAALQRRELPSDPTHYLRIAVLNRARSALRRRRIARTHLGRAEISEPVEPADAALLRDERGRTLLAVVDGLPHRQREVVVLRYYEDLSIDEIASTLGTSRTAVSTALTRALKTLSARLGERP